MDLGVYALQLQQWAFKGLKPTKILAGGHLNEYGTDDSSSGILIYPDGKTAIVATSTVIKLTNEAVIIGTKGEIRVRSAVHF